MTTTRPAREGRLTWANWRQKRADRRMWRQARTLTTLGELMAHWLQGNLSLRPGYQPGYGPDTETTDLIPVLANANRAGFLTTDSQPGCDEIGTDGRHWQQRAAVTGFVGSEKLLHQLGYLAETHRLELLVRDVADGRTRVGRTVTRVGGEPYTVFGAPLSRRDLRRIWQGVSRPALTEITDAWQVTLIDSKWGRNDLLWTALDTAIAPHGDTVPTAA